MLLAGEDILLVGAIPLYCWMGPIKEEKSRRHSLLTYEAGDAGVGKGCGRETRWRNEENN